MSDSDPKHIDRQLVDFFGGLLGVLTAIPMFLGGLILLIVVLFIPIGIVLSIIRALF